VIWMLAYYWKKDKRLATAWAVNLGTIFFLAASTELLNRVTNKTSAFWWWVIYLLIWASIFSGLQWWIRKRLNPRKTAKAVWRIGFLTSVVVYAVAFIVSVFQVYLHS